MTSADPSQSFTTLDWIGTVVTGTNALGLLLFPLAGRSFALMFQEFGAENKLPALTHLAISWWFPMMFGVLVAAGVVLGIRRTTPIERRRAWIVGAFVLGGVGFGVCLAGVYLPIFALADAIQGE
jgi:hypothetical protein